MDKPSLVRRHSWVAGVIAGCVIPGVVFPVAAQPSAPPAKQERNTSQKQPAGDADVLRRLKELETQVAQSQAEIAKLQAELSRSKKDEKRETESFGKAGEPGVSRSGSSAAAGPARGTPAASKAAQADEWAEPEIEKKQQGRDEEARRRLLELETQFRRTTAEAAKQEEQRKDKFKLDLSGKYKVQANSRRNFNLENPNQAWTYDNASFFDQRFQLTLDATYEAFLTRLTLDQGNFVFDWKEDSQGTLSRWGEFLTVNSQLVRELFVQYTGPFMLRVGRQNWDVGHSIVLEGPVDSVRLQYPLGQLGWGQTTFNAGYLSVGGGWSSYQVFRQTGGPPAGIRTELLGAANQLNAYYLDLDVRPSRALRLRPYLLKVGDRGGSASADLNLDKDFNAATTPRDGNFQPLWAGVAASADLKTWKFDAEAVSLSGSYTKEREVSAYALFARGARDLGKVGSLGNLVMGLEFARGSGNGTADASSGTLRNFNALFLCRDRHSFGNIFSRNLRAGYFLWDSNLSNITYVRFDATLEPVKNLKLMPSVTRSWTTKEVFAGRGPVFDWSTGFGRSASTASSTRTTRDVGWEFDLNGSYPLLRNVDGFFTLGYFQPGAVYAKPDGSNPKRAFEVVLGAELKF